MTDFRINVIVDPSKALRPMDKVDNRLKKTEAVLSAFKVLCPEPLP